MSLVTILVEKAGALFGFPFNRDRLPDGPEVAPPFLAAGGGGGKELPGVGEEGGRGLPAFVFSGAFPYHPLVFLSLVRLNVTVDSGCSA